MRRRSPFQRVYLSLLTLLLLASSAAIIGTAPPLTPALILLAVLCGLVDTVLNTLVVRLETTTPDSPVFVDVTPAVLIFTVVTTGHYGFLSLLAAATLARWIKLGRHQPFGYLFNAADVSITYAVLLALDGYLRVGDTFPNGPPLLLWAFALLSAYLVMNMLYGGLLTSVGARRPFVEVVRTLYLPTAWIECIPFAMGLISAVLYRQLPWLLPLALLPLVLAYRALQAIAAWLAANNQLRQLNEELRESKEYLEQRVAERTTALVAANDELARIQHHREQEVTDAAHDINQVLRTAVHALSTRTAAQRTQSAHELVALLSPAMDVLEDMKLAARLRNDSLTLSPRPTDLVALIAETVQHCRPRFENAGCLLSVEVYDDIPLLECDSPRLRRVLVNLLDNALTYTSQRPDGRVTLTISTEEKRVAVQVSDNGVGIAPEHLQRIGERFFRVAEGLERPESSGLGLACSTRIVALSGGSLQVYSDGLGCGTSVIVSLPLAEQERAVGAGTPLQAEQAMLNRANGTSLVSENRAGSRGNDEQ